MSDGWKQATLGDVLTLQRGFDLPVQTRSVGSVPVVASTGIVGSHAEAAVSAPGVVIGRSGSIGGAQYLTEDFWPLNTTLWVKDFKGSDPRFIYYLLRSMDFSGMNAGSGVPTLNRNHIHPLQISVPGRAEQRAITGVLGALDDKIELNRRMNETLAELAQLRFDAAPGPDWLPLGQLVTLARDTVDPGAEADERFEHFSIPAFDDGQAPVVELGSAIKSSKLSVPADAVLLSKLNPRIPRVWLPDLRDARRPVCSTEFLVVLPAEHISREFLYCLFHSSAFVGDFAGRVAGTSGSHQRVKAADALTIQVAVPEPTDLAELTATLRPLFDRIAANRRESRTLAKLRDALLPKLISGELRVRDVEAAAESVEPEPKRT